MNEICGLEVIDVGARKKLTIVSIL
jgi:hypothetical protein